MWVLAFGVAAAFLVALILFVSIEGPAANKPAAVTNPSAIAEQNREDRAQVQADQTPHVVTVRGGVAGQSALQVAVVRYMKRQIALGTVQGPLTRSSCTPAAGSSPVRPAFSCAVVAGNVTYPFLGVANSSRQVTFCKRDYAPVWGMNVPVSGRCT